MAVAVDNGDMERGTGGKPETEDAAIPTLQEVIAFGAKWPGEPARGIPAGIPRDFCETYFEAKQTKNTWTNRNRLLINWRLEIAGQGWWRDQWRTWKQERQHQQSEAPKSAWDLTLRDIA
jgi:hypothetical protein